MSTSGGDRLYSFLPRIYRVLDAEQGHPLRALVDVIGREFDRQHGNITQLYDNAFIETCEAAVIPYLGELVGQRVTEREGLPAHLWRMRVANAIRHRRRKGRADTLEEALHEASGWSALVLDDARLLSTTRSVQYGRPEQGHAPDVRQSGASVTYGASTRGGESSFGPQSQVNLQHVHILINRTRVYPVERSEPFRVAEGCFTFHALGRDTALYTLTRREGRVEELPAKVEHPLPLSPGLLEALERRAPYEGPVSLHRYVGPGRSVDVQLSGASVPAEDFHLAELERWHRPGPSHVGLRSGRLHLSDVPHPLQLTVRIGEDGPHVVHLAHSARESVPALARALEDALRAASDRPSFALARALAVGHHLVVLPGVPLAGDPVHFSETLEDPHSVHALRLSRPEAQRVAVLLSHELPTATFEATQGALSLRLGDTAPVEVSVPLGEDPDGLARALNEQLAPHAGWHAHAEGALLLVVAEAPEPTQYLRTGDVSGAQPDAARRLGLRPRVAVDSQRGRFTVSLGTPEGSPRVSWAYGRAADLGAGPSPRDVAPRPSAASDTAWYAEVSKRFDLSKAAPSGTLRFNELAKAIEAWNALDAADAAPRAGRLVILDSATYAPATGAERFELGLGARALRLEAADGELPSLSSALAVYAAGGRLALDGVQCPGLGLHGGLTLEVAHCTFLGPLASGPRATGVQRLALRDSLLGPLRLHAAGTRLQLSNCLVRGERNVALRGARPGTAGPPVELERCTVLGQIYAEAITRAHDCLLTERVRVLHANESGLQWCALPWSSRGLPHQHCILFSAPAEAVKPGVLASAPSFVSRSPSAAGYGRLAEGGPPELLYGSEDGGELGAFHDLHEGQRLAELRETLDEYLPAGLSAGTTFLD